MNKSIENIIGVWIDIIVGKVHTLHTANPDSIPNAIYEPQIPEYKARSRP